MDKIKPLLVHKFWFLFAFALILPAIGWKLDTGSLAEETASRKTAVDSAHSGARLPNGAPNDEYVAGITKANEELKRRYEESVRHLWQVQQELMFWPADIAGYMQDVPYRGHATSSNPVTGKPQDDVRPRQIYRTAYFRDVRKVREHVEPFNPLDGTGKVDFPEEVMPQVDREEWADLPPTWDRMWDEQEDLWLLQSVLGAIRHTNQDAPDIAKSPVRSIVEIALRGGDRSKLDQPAGGEAGDGPGGPGGMPEGRGGSFFGGGRSSREKSASVAFDPATEFGPDTLADTGEGGSPDGPGGMPMEAGGPVGRLQGDKTPGKRYVDDDEKLPFKTRGFYLHVKMDHRRLPDLLASLSNMPWPTTILRVNQMSSNSTDGSVNVVGGGPGGPDVGPMGGGRRPMGTPRIGAGDPMGIGGDTPDPSQTAQMKLEAAMSDPYLADVVIAGLMTIYRPPPEEEQAAEESGAAAPDTTTPAAEPAATPAEAVPAGTDPAATENPGTPAPPNASEPEGTPAPADAPASPADSTTPADPAGSADPAAPASGAAQQPPGEAAPASQPATGDS